MLPDAAFDVVAEGTDDRGGETRRVVQVVTGFVAFPGEDGTGVAAAHGDHDIGGADGFVGPGFRNPLNVLLHTFAERPPKLA